MKSLIFSCIFFCLVSQQVTADFFSEIIALDCDGTFTLGGSSIPVSFDASFLIKMYNFQADLIKERVKCECPGISDLDFERRFVPSVRSMVNAFREPQNRKGFSVDCPSDKFPRNLNDPAFWLFNGDNSFLLPTECGDALDAGNDCKLDLGIPDLDVTLQMTFGVCQNSVMPSFSLGCTGAGCNSFASPCTSDSDCVGTGTYCLLPEIDQAQFQEDIFNILIEMGLLSNDTAFPGCYPVGELIDSFANFVSKKYFGMEETQFGKVGICTFEPETYTYTNNPTTLSFQSISTSTGDIEFNNVVPSTEVCVNMTCPVGDECCEKGDWIYNPTLQDYEWIVETTYEYCTLSVDNMVTGTGPDINGLPLVQDNLGDLTVLLRTTCDMEIEFFPTEVYSFTTGMSGSVDILEFLVTEARKIIECSNTLTDSQFAARFVPWSPEFLMNAFTSPVYPGWDSGPDMQDPVSKILEQDLTRLIMPSTCNFQKFVETGVCRFAYDGLKDLLLLDISLIVEVTTCKGTYLPSVAIECQGSGCKTLLRPESCSVDSDCSDSQAVCFNMKEELFFKDNVTDIDIVGKLLWGISDVVQPPKPSNYYGYAQEESVGLAAIAFLAGPFTILARSSCEAKEIDYIPQKNMGCAGSDDYGFKDLRSAIRFFANQPMDGSADLSFCMVDIEYLFGENSTHGSDWADSEYIATDTTIQFSGMKPNTEGISPGVEPNPDPFQPNVEGNTTNEDGGVEASFAINSFSKISILFSLISVFLIFQ